MEKKKTNLDEKNSENGMENEIILGFFNFIKGRINNKIWKMWRMRENHL